MSPACTYDKGSFRKIKEDKITVVVENIASKENVKKFAERQGCHVEIKEEKGAFFSKDNKRLYLRDSPRGKRTITRSCNTYITSDKLGNEEKLGRLLMEGSTKTNWL